jgi:signal transduction histidine kinase/ActR/RegA family two-component response regulator
MHFSFGIVAGLAVLYFVAAKVGLLLAAVSPSATPVWPPTGIAFAMCLVLGARVWPAIFAAAFLANITTAGSVVTSLGIAAGNTLEALVGAYLIGRLANGPAVFDRARDIFAFVGLAALASTTVSATIGLTTLALGGYVQWAELGSVWLTWWLGDATGNLIFAPLIVLWARNRSLQWIREQLIEAAVLLGALVLVGVGVFGRSSTFGSFPLDFLCLPLLLWAAFRFGPRETATATVLLSAFATWGMLKDSDPWTSDFRNSALLLSQVFLATMSVTALATSVLVSERRRAEAVATEAADTAESANRAKDDFLAMLGHELRNPLGAIASAVRVLERVDNDAARAVPARAIIARQVDRLARMVDDLLDVTRVTTGKIALQRRPVDLVDGVSACLAALNAAKRLEGYELQVEAEPVWVDADPARLEQIVMNLLLNALKYTPPGGRIRVVTRAERDEGVLRVEDTGIGISPELMPRIFDLFVQGHREPDRAPGGMGVGLTLVRRLTDLHGGQVDVASDGSGRGSVFTVRLPLAAAPQVLVESSKVSTTEAIRRRVLTIEDYADARDSLRSLLELSGHEVREAADGPTGVELALRLQPDVVLIDIGLPGLDGYGVARRIRSDPHGHLMVLAAVTGYGQPEDRRRAEEAGFDALLVKPVDPDQLTEILATRRP